MNAMRLTKWWIGVALVIGLLLGGCGGSSRTENAATMWMQRYLAALGNQDSTQLTGLISASYLQDCRTRAQEVAFFQNIFDNATSITVSFDVNSSSVDNSTGRGEIRGLLVINATGPGGYSFSSSSVRRFNLVREAGVWRESGNQLCP